MGPLAMLLLLIWQIINSIFARFLCQPRVAYGTVGLHFSERFDALAGIVKLVMAAIAAFCVAMPVVTTVSATIGNGMLLATARMHPPFAHKWLAQVALSCHAAALAASCVALVTVVACDTMADGSSSCGYYPQICLGVVWVAISGSTIHLVSNSRSFGRGLRQGPALIVGDPNRQLFLYKKKTPDEEETGAASP